MIQIKVKGKELDLYKNTSIAIERASPIWFGGDIENIGGTVTIPFEIPLTRNNVDIMGFVNHLGNRQNITQYEHVEILLYQNTHLSGVMDIEEINSETISLKIYDGVGALQVFKNTLLNDALIYNEGNSATYTVSVATMNASLTRDEILYLPYWVDDLLGSEWDAENQTYLSNVRALPQVSALFLLEKVLTWQGWTLRWRDKESFRRSIFLNCNNRVSFSHFLYNILPSVSISEFIKQFAIVTGHYIEINFIDKVLTFSKYSDLGKGQIIDWTDKIINVDSQKFLNFGFDFDTQNHIYNSKNETETKTYSAGTINYSRNYLLSKSDLVTSILTTENNLEKVHFFEYNGLVDSAYTLGTGDVSDVEDLQYPSATSLNHISDNYNIFLDSVGESRILTAMIFLSPNELKNFSFGQVIRIFNSRDGSFYNFLIKSIKQSITSQRHELAEIELVLLK